MKYAVQSNFSKYTTTDVSTLHPVPRASGGDMPKSSAPPKDRSNASAYAPWDLLRQWGSEGRRCVAF